MLKYKSLFTWLLTKILYNIVMEYVVNMMVVSAHLDFGHLCSQYLAESSEIGWLHVVPSVSNVNSLKLPTNLWCPSTNNRQTCSDNSKYMHSVMMAWIMCRFIPNINNGNDNQVKVAQLISEQCVENVMCVYSTIVLLFS